MQLSIPSIDFSELDYKKIGSWPLLLRVLIILVSVSIILYFGYNRITNASNIIKQQQSETLEALKKEFSDKYKTATQITQYKANLDKLKQQFDFLIKEFPTVNQTPQIIAEMSRIGTRYSLINRAILPQTFTKKEFFYEEPIDISFEGTFKNILKFVDYLNNADNFVKFSDFSLDGPANASTSEDPKLIFNVKIFTYWRPANEF